MSGLIQGAQAQSSTLSPASVRAKMNIPPQLLPIYNRVIVAAQKIMYSPQMEGQIKQVLQGPGTIGQKLGQAIVGLLAIIISHSNNTMPKQLIIPVGIELVTEGADFLRKAGMQVSDQDISQGVSVMVQDILQRSGVNPAQIAQAVQQAGGAPAAQGAPQPALAAPQGA